MLMTKVAMRILEGFEPAKKLTVTQEQLEKLIEYTAKITLEYKSVSSLTWNQVVEFTKKDVMEALETILEIKEG